MKNTHNQFTENFWNGAKFHPFSMILTNHDKIHIKKVVQI